MTSAQAPVARFANPADGIASEVYELPLSRGYSVVLRDTDADEIMPVVEIYRTVMGAIAHARSLVSYE